jgi:hypothetical protein
MSAPSLFFLTFPLFPFPYCPLTYLPIHYYLLPITFPLTGGQGTQFLAGVGRAHKKRTYQSELSSRPYAVGVQAATAAIKPPLSNRQVAPPDRLRSHSQALLAQNQPQSKRTQFAPYQSYHNAKPCFAIHETRAAFQFTPTLSAIHAP